MTVDVMSMLGQKSAPPATTYNNGKDLMPQDIVAIREMDVITEKPKLDAEGKEIWHAFLGVIAYTGVIQQPPKYYRSTASTEKEAKENLVDILKAHLDRAINS